MMQTKTPRKNKIFLGVFAIYLDYGTARIEVVSISQTKHYGATAASLFFNQLSIASLEK